MGACGLFELQSEKLCEFDSSQSARSVKSGIGHRVLVKDITLQIRKKIGVIYD